MRGHTDTITSMALSNCGSFVLTNSMDNTLRTWDIRPFVTKGILLIKKYFIYFLKKNAKSKCSSVTSTISRWTCSSVPGPRMTRRLRLVRLIGNLFLINYFLIKNQYTDSSTCGMWTRARSSTSCPGTWARSTRSNSIRLLRNPLVLFLINYLKILI